MEFSWPSIMRRYENRLLLKIGDDSLFSFDWPADDEEGLESGKN